MFLELRALWMKGLLGSGVKGHGNSGLGVEGLWGLGPRDSNIP